MVHEEPAYHISIPGLMQCMETGNEATRVFGKDYTHTYTHTRTHTHTYMHTRTHIHTGVAYFVFTEKLNVYDDTDQLLKEFREAALNFVASLSKIAIAPPLYKIYATKAYRDHLQSISRVHTFGELNILTSIFHCTIW